ncbi:MYO15B isoform 19, partial [Pongo abelii]
GYQPGMVPAPMPMMPAMGTVPAMPATAAAASQPGRRAAGRPAAELYQPAGANPGPADDSPGHDPVPGAADTAAAAAGSGLRGCVPGLTLSRHLQAQEAPHTPGEATA